MAIEEAEAEAAEADAELAAEEAAAEVLEAVAEADEAAKDEEEAEPEPELPLFAAVAFRLPHFSLVVHVAWPSASLGWLSMHC